MKKMLLVPATMLVAVAFLTGCSNDTEPKASEKVVKKESSDHIDYKNQKDWKFESGDSQSPINIETAKTEPMKDSGEIELDYSDAVVDEVDNGHSIQVDDTGTAKINGRNFELSQFHFHAKSEHTLNGEHYPIEAHFVNQSQDGRIAVIGVFFKEGKENAGFNTVLANIKKGEKVKVGDTINVASMLPENKSYYHYLGSLTTPPLSENVEWYVMANPVEVSSEQIKEFDRYYDANNREIQKLNGRTVLEHKE
ncbi:MULTISPECIES: carbonic anhydrase [Listeria]|uniref:carbonic anhydrase n=1 Tax=Listeria TaxID=1637 RepID=UPI000B587D77|nr:MULTISPECIES: carbonic anhydrase family protein [Listeria]